MEAPYVIAEYPDIAFIAKPSPLIVHSDGRTHEPTLTEWLVDRFPGIEKVGDTWISPQGDAIPLPGIVHRLDRTTTGIMVVAKTDAGFIFLKNSFKERRVKKTYSAIVNGTLTGAGVVVAEIMRTKTAPRYWYARETTHDDIRAAITEWRAQQALPGATFVEATPLTGRTHQIRVHMQSIGHPLVGDHLYSHALPSLFGFTRPALHAKTLGLMLPNGLYAEHNAPLPHDFVAALQHH